MGEQVAAGSSSKIALSAIEDQNQFGFGLR
jgi:hypothetical protein